MGTGSQLSSQMMDYEGTMRKNEKSIKRVIKGLGPRRRPRQPGATPAPRSVVGGGDLWDLATATLSRPEQAFQWTNRGNEYTEMKL